MKNTKIKVTDHAIVRYIERVMGFDTSQIRHHISNADNVKLLEVANGYGFVPVDDYVALFKNWHCITVRHKIKIPKNLKTSKNSNRSDFRKNERRENKA